MARVPGRERAVTASPLVSRSGSPLCSAPSSDVMVLYPRLRSGSVLNGRSQEGQGGKTREAEKERRKGGKDRERASPSADTRRPGASACHTWEPGA